MSKPKGQTVVEILLAISILAIFGSSSTIAILISTNSTLRSKKFIQGTFLASQGIQASESIANQSWDNLTNGDHGLSNSDGQGPWTFSGEQDSEFSEAFTRTITISSVQRDQNGNITSEGGTLDPDSKQIVSTVSWYHGSNQKQVILTSLLTNWQLARSELGVSAPTPSSCSDYCALLGLSTGTCRELESDCTPNNQLYKPQGDQYCSQQGGENVCCCNQS